jgi:hypothetical protein
MSKREESGKCLCCFATVFLELDLVDALLRLQGEAMKRPRRQLREEILKDYYF